MARRKKTQQEEQGWRSRVAGAKPPLTGNNLAYGPVTGLGDMGIHLPREQAANYIDPTSVFLHDVVNNTVSLDPARREEFARILNQAYHSLDVTPQTQLDSRNLVFPPPQRLESCKRP